MTYSDASHCIFQPMIGKRLPDRYKNIILSIPDYSKAKNNLVDNPNFEKWVEKFGDNFGSRFPMLFKYGVYR